MKNKINALVIACKLCDMYIDEEQADLVVNLYELLLNKNESVRLTDIEQVHWSIRQKHRLNRKNTMPL